MAAKSKFIKKSGTLPEATDVNETNINDEVNNNEEQYSSNDEGKEKENSNVIDNGEGVNTEENNKGEENNKNNKGKNLKMSEDKEGLLNFKPNMTSDTTTFEPEQTKEKLVKVKLNNNFRCCVGGERYDFKKDEVYLVNRNIKRILNKSGLLKPLS